eukprot:m.183644 g.183644  ORF g.183644 m.183644 type:complete len:64 (+) comp16656_c0_seq3:129-320(+)
MFHRITEDEGSLLKTSQAKRKPFASVASSFLISFTRTEDNCVIFLSHLLQMCLITLKDKNASH